MPQPNPDNAITDKRRLNSWKEIAAYLGKDVRTVQRWEAREGLPIHRKPHDKLSSVYAYEAEIDSWWDQGSHPNPVGRPTETTHKRPTLIVLPLRNLSGDPEQEYFSDGLTGELISQIGRLGPTQLGVIASASAMKYKQSKKGIDQIRRELGVSHVLEGSVRRVGDRVRVAVTLVQTADQTGLWSEAYDRDLSDILKLQTELAATVAENIAREITQHYRSNSSSVSPDAYNAYLQGRYLWNRRTRDTLQKAIVFFEEAIRHDPRYANPYAGLADCYGLMTSVQIGAIPPAEGMPRAIAAAERALKIDPSLAEAYASLGLARLWYGWDWPAAGACFKRALELNPSDISARQWYAGYLHTIGKGESALAELGKALELDPLSLVLRCAIGATHYLERQYDLAATESLKTLELDRSFVLAYFNLGRAHTQLKKHRKAIAELEKAYELSEGSPSMMMQLGYAYAMAGKKPEARRMLASLSRLARKQFVPSFYFAAIHAGLGDAKQAIAFLRKAHRERCDYLPLLAMEPAADSLRSEPGFADLIPRPPSELIAGGG